MRSSVLGKYSLSVINGEGEVVKNIEFSNLVTEIGLSFMGSSNQYLNICRVGSGTTPPVASDRSLKNQIASVGHSGTSGGTTSSPPFYAWSRRSYKFSVGQVVGLIGEVGVGWHPTGDTLFSRALIRDGNGNPISLMVQPDEYLLVTYEHRYYVPTRDSVSNLNILGALGGDYKVTSRAAMCTSANHWVADSRQNNSFSSVTAFEGGIGEIDNQPTGIRVTMGMQDGVQIGDRVTFYLAAEPHQLNLDNGIRSLMMRMGNGCYQFQFDPPIMKDSESTLRLQLTHSWGRR